MGLNYCSVCGRHGAVVFAPRRELLAIGYCRRTSAAWYDWMEDSSTTAGSVLDCASCLEEHLHGP